MRAYLMRIGSSLLLFGVRADKMRTQRADALLLPRVRAGEVTARDVAAFCMAALCMTTVQM